LGDQAFVGAGGIAAGAPEVARSVVEATHACRFAERRRDARYLTHDTIASHALLVGLQDDHLLGAFHASLIQPLETHDTQRHTDLLETLERFLGSGGRYQQTAEALHIHVNTLRLRLARIETLTGRDLNAMDDRVDFWLALRARSL
jgi:PucR family transcriptional regulator, purine catabolism regulatory protein